MFCLRWSVFSCIDFFHKTMKFYKECMNKPYFCQKFLLTDWRHMRRKYNRNIVDLWTSWSSFQWTSIDCFGPTKYPWEKLLDSQNTDEKNFSNQEIPTRKTSHSRSTHEKKIGTHEGAMIQWDETYETTMTQDPHNLIHSLRA